MGKPAFKAGLIGIVAIAIAVLGSQLIVESDGTSELGLLPEITTSRSSGLVDEIAQPGGSSIRAGVSNSVGFVVRNSKGDVVQSGTVSGD